MLSLIRRFIAWRARNLLRASLNRTLHYQGGFIGNIISAIIGGNAQTSAADTAASAANQATATQKAMFDQTQANVAPWLAAGKGSLAQLVAGTAPGGSLLPQSYSPFTMDKFHQDPGYQFQRQQGLDALTNQSSITGGPNSNNLKGMVQFSEGLANTDYQQALQNYINQFLTGNQARSNQFSTLETLSQGGLGAGLGQGQISAGVGQNIGNNTIAGGNAQAAGQLGAAGTMLNFGNKAYNNFLQSQFMNQWGVPAQQAAAPVSDAVVNPVF